MSKKKTQKPEPKAEKKPGLIDKDGDGKILDDIANMLLNKKSK